MAIFASALYYLSTYCLSAICLKNSKPKKLDGWFVLAVLLPVILAAIRINTGTDYESYVAMYNANSKLSFVEWFALNRGFDGDRIGIWLFSQASKIFGSEKFFFFLFAFFICCPVLWVLKNQYPQCVFLASFCFLTTTFTSGLNICKQALAASILFCGLNCVIQRKFARYIIHVLLAMCFHITAAAGMIFYFLYGKTKNRKVIGQIVISVIIMCAILLLPQILTLFGGRFEGYIDYDGNISNRSFYLDMALLVMFVILRKRYLCKNKHIDLCIVMFLIGVLLELTGFRSPYIKRISSYFTIAQIVLLAQIPYIFASKRKKILYVSVAFYLTCMFIIIYCILGQSDIIPYRSNMNFMLNFMVIFEIILCAVLILRRLYLHRRRLKCDKERFIYERNIV